MPDRLHRRAALQAGVGLLATPAIRPAQTPEIFVGGPASPSLADGSPSRA